MQVSKSLPALPSLAKEPAADPLRATAPPGQVQFNGSASSSALSLPAVKADFKPKVSFNRDAQFEEFWSRQTNSSQEVRLEIAKYQRDSLEKMRNQSASIKFNGKEHYLTMLRHRYGTITAAWRQLLDPAGTGKLSFSDFCNTCRDMGYQRKMKQLWVELDSEQKGCVFLYQLDPDAARMMQDFRRCCRLNYGDLLTAWHAFDRDKNQRLDPQEFAEKCADIKYKSTGGNSRKLFVCLKRDVARNFLTIADFDERSMQCMHRGDEHMLTVKPKKSIIFPGIHESALFHALPHVAEVEKEDDDDEADLDTAAHHLTPRQTFLREGPPQIAAGHADLLAQLAHHTATSMNSTGSSEKVTNMKVKGDTMGSRWIKEMSNSQISDRNAFHKKQKDKDQGMKCAEGLKRNLIVQFGSIFGGWRTALDLDGNGRLSFGEFCLALRNLGFTGNVKALFNSLDTDQDGFVGLGDIDAKTEHMMTSYKELVLGKYANTLQCWLAMSVGNAQQVDEANFDRHCKDLGWTGNTKTLFNNLKEEKSRRFMTLRDYDPQAWSCQMRGDMGMMSQEKVDTIAQSKLNFYDRQAVCFSQRWARAKAKEDIAGMAKMKAENMVKDLGAQDPESLRAVLIHKFGTMTAAWKHGLDKYGNGRLPFGEFCNAMRGIGFSGDIRQCFKELDVDEKGAVTLADLDEEAHLVVSEFRELCLSKYGSYIKAWSAMDTDKNGVLEVDEMVQACENIGYVRDSATLFRYLLDGPGKNRITLADLDPVAMQAFWRGDLEALSPLQKAKDKIASNKNAEQAQREKRMEAYNWKTLKTNLIRKYGTITSAWREGLDQNGNGKVSFVDFSKRARELGFSGDIKATFHELDADDSGIISFNEVDHVWYERIANFCELLLGAFCSFEDAWTALDENKNNMVEDHEFRELCEKLGYVGNPNALFKQLLKNPMRKYLAVEDLEAKAAIVQGNKEDSRSGQNFYMKSDSMMSNDEKAKRALEDRQKLEKSVKAKQIGAQDWTQLKNQLIAKYGTIVAAWRFALDWSGDGRLSKTEFCDACRNHGFQGNVMLVYKQIDDDNSGVISFDEVDLEWFNKLKLFRELLLERFGDYDTAWKGFDKDKRNKLEIDDFVRVCGDMGYTADPKALFKQLAKNLGRQFLTMEDLLAASTMVTKAVERARLFPPQTASPSSSKGFNSSKGFGSTNGNGFGSSKGFNKTNPKPLS